MSDKKELTKVLDVHVLKLFSVRAFVDDPFLAKAALLVDFAVGRKRLIGVAANLYMYNNSNQFTKQIFLIHSTLVKLLNSIVCIATTTEEKLLRFYIKK